MNNAVQGWKQMQKQIVIASLMLVLMMVLPSATAVVRIRADTGEPSGVNLTVQNQMATAVADDRVVTLEATSPCVYLDIVVGWQYDGSGNQARFWGSSSHGGGFDENKLTSSNGNEHIETTSQVCVGGEVLYDIGAVAFNDSGTEVSNDDDQGKVVYVTEV